MGFSFSAILNEPLGVPFAFFLGTFPANTLYVYGRRFVDQKLGIGEQNVAGKSELEQLQGINRTEVERFQEEGILNILQLAYTNPVDLTFRTNFEFNYVVDCISQALLWLYLGEHGAKLRVRGLRNAQDVYILFERLKSKDAREKKTAEQTLASTAAALGLREEELRHALINVAQDPYTEFICNVWG